MQADLMRGQNRPYLLIDVIKAEGEKFVLEALNKGNGIAKRIDIDNEIYVWESDAEKFGWVEEETEAKDAYLPEEGGPVIELSDVLSDKFNKNGVSKSVARPGKDTMETISIRPDSEETRCFAEPRYCMTVNGEYHEFSVSVVLDVLSDLGLSKVCFHWIVEYEGLSDVRYFESIESSCADVKKCDDLTDMLSSGTTGFVEDMRISTPDYYEYHSSLKSSR